MKPIAKKESFEVVARVAAALQELLDDVVFVGGSAVAFLITDEDIVTVRPTLDVDIIVEVMSLADYHRFEKRLKKLGFVSVPDGPVCRFSVNGIIVEVMPDDEFMNLLPGFVDSSGGAARATVVRDRLQGLVDSLTG